MRIWLAAAAAAWGLDSAASTIVGRWRTSSPWRQLAREASGAPATMAKARIAYRVGGARLAEQPLFPYQLSRPRRNTARLTTPRAAFASGVSAPLSAGTSCAGSPSQYCTLHSSVAHEGPPADSHDFLRIKLPKPRRFLKAMAAESVVGYSALHTLCAGTTNRRLLRAGLLASGIWCVARAWAEARRDLISRGSERRAKR